MAAASRQERLLFPQRCHVVGPRVDHHPPLTKIRRRRFEIGAQHRPQRIHRSRRREGLGPRIPTDDELESGQYFASGLGRDAWLRAQLLDQRAEADRPALQRRVSKDGQEILARVGVLVRVVTQVPFELFWVPGRFRQQLQVAPEPAPVR
eukprot:2726046-Rhodomonas_salina.1